MPERSPPERFAVGDKLINAASRTEAKVARIVTMDGDLEAADPASR